MLGLFMITACNTEETNTEENQTGMLIAGMEVIINAGDEAGTSGGMVAGAEAGTEAGITAGEEAGMTAGAQMSLSTDYSQIRLNEIAPKGNPFDWVELINLSNQRINLAECFLSDDPDDLMKYELPTGVESQVPAQGFVLMILNDDSTGFALGSAEGVYVSDPNGMIIDQIEYTSEQAIENTTLGRLPDGTGEWQILYTETPNAPNMAGMGPVCGDGLCDNGEVCEEDCIVCGDGFCDLGEVCELDCQTNYTLVINEVIAAGMPDGIELVNIGDDTLDLSDVFITDDRNEPNKARLSGLIEPNQYLWIEVSDEGLGFKLKGDEEVFIFDEEGRLIDGVDWVEGDSPEGQSYRRTPDIVGSFMTGSSSPGLEND